MLKNVPPSIEMALAVKTVTPLGMQILYKVDTSRCSDRMKECFDRIEGLLDGLIEDVGMLKGAHTRDAARRRADLIAEDLGLRLVRVLSRDDLRPLIRSQHAADIPASHLRSFLLADLLVEAANQDGEMVYAAVEISFTVKGRDLTKALRNAGFLSRFTGRPARVVVAGACLDEGIRDHLESEGVFWYELSLQSLDAG